MSSGNEFDNEFDNVAGMPVGGTKGEGSQQTEERETTHGKNRS
jgi:hypothetical protein